MIPHVMLSPRWVRSAELTRVGLVDVSSWNSCLLQMHVAWNAGTFNGRVWCFTGEARTVRWCCHATEMLYGNPRQVNGQIRLVGSIKLMLLWRTKKTAGLSVRGFAFSVQGMD
jgi:hypothetical protein